MSIQFENELAGERGANAPVVLTPSVQVCVSI